jgi:acetyl esterase/lipase
VSKRPPDNARRISVPSTLILAVASACALAVAIAATVLFGAPSLTQATADSAANRAAAATPTARAVAAKGTSRIAPAVPRVGIRTFVAPRGIRVASNLTYGTASDGQALKLDVCSPAAASGAEPSAQPGASAAVAPLPAVLSIHGGSWSHGDKSSTDWHAVCEWLASEGFVAYSVDYRLVPTVRFPAPIDDVTRALEWVREPQNVERFNIDPRRIGVFGGSAGGNLAALLGMRGHGDIHTGTRVAAVAELSGPVDLTASGQRLGNPSEYLRSIELAYLGCTEFDSCQAASAASAVSYVDPSDPPVFIGGSDTELVPVEQGTSFAAALAAAGVPHTLRIDTGHWHSIATLNAPMRTAVAAFLHEYLG